MAKVKSWKVGETGHPDYPDDFEIVRRVVLQVTKIGTNNNKYYGLELHKDHAGGARVYTHYGRTDDLLRDPSGGQRECRYFESVPEAAREYDSIYREKTSEKKGYREVSLASSAIGSPKAAGLSAGEVDAKTLERRAKKPESNGADGPVQPVPSLEPEMDDLISYLFTEATKALTETVQVIITAKGIETPLGILTLGQIDRGQLILDEAYEVFKKGGKSVNQKLEELSGHFYSAIPHRLGRTRDALAAAILADLTAFAQKNETLQLMRDMLAVDGEEGGGVLASTHGWTQYKSLGAELRHIPAAEAEAKAIKDLVEKSQIKTKSIKVNRVFAVRRPGEAEAFEEKLGNVQKLFHGSRVHNWVGLLTRGILLPKIVVKMGVNRTDAGWLGNGLYFGDAACTSAFYTSPGRRKTRFLAVTSVALGKVKEFYKITYGMDQAPEGYDSCHGVRTKLMKRSEFADDEFTVYRSSQQRMDYLVEFAMN